MKVETSSLNRLLLSLYAVSSSLLDYVLRLFSCMINDIIRLTFLALPELFFELIMYAHYAVQI